MPKAACCCLLLVLIFSFAEAQQPRAQFPVKYDRASQHSLALDNNFAYLLLHHPGAYEFFILDSLLQPVQRNFVKKTEDLQHIRLVTLLPGTDELLMLYQEASPLKGLRSLRINKSTGTYKKGKLYLEYDPTWTMLRTFTHEESYYLLSHNRLENQLRLTEINSREGLRQLTFKAPTVDLAKRVKKRAIPIISLDFPQTIHATSREKLYVGEKVIRLVVEQERKNQTIWVSIDLEEMKEAVIDSIAYHIPLYAKGRPKIANSFLYKDVLMQAIADPNGQNLNLVFRDLNGKQILRDWTFLDDEGLGLLFSNAWERRIRPNSGKENLRQLPSILKKMNGKLALYMTEAESSGPILTLGFWKTKRIRPDELSILGLSLSYNAAFLSGDLPLKNQDGLSYNPFIGLISLGYGLYGVQSLERHRFSFLQASFDPENLSLAQWNPVGNTTSRMRMHMAENKRFKKAKAKTIFTWNGNRYLGYHLNGVFHFISL